MFTRMRSIAKQLVTNTERRHTQNPPPLFGGGSKYRYRTTYARVGDDLRSVSPMRVQCKGNYRIISAILTAVFAVRT